MQSDSDSFATCSEKCGKVKHTGSAFVIGLLSMVLAMVSPAHSSSVAECDRLASFDLDHQRRAEPVPWFKIKFDEAITACEAASREHPRDGRLWLQLGRAYERKAWETVDQSLYSRAYDSYQQSAQLKHVAAFWSLGSLHQTPDYTLASPKKAFESYTEGSRLGDPSSMAELADMYAYFKYPAQDCGTAWRLLQTAKRSPTRRVYSTLGVLHRDGVCAHEAQEARVDLTLALTYFRQAADFDDPYSYNNLAASLLEVQGDSAAAEAMQLYLKSVELGVGLGARNIGQLYQTGRGTRQSDSEAVKWYERGAVLRDTRAMRDLAFMLRAGRLGAIENSPNVTEADIWEKRARELARRRADHGAEFEMHQLAIMKWEGIGGQRDIAGAIRYAEMAADRGVLEAINYLGFLYEKTGRLVEAATQYQRGDRLGLSVATSNLGKAYYYGRGLDKDPAKGKSLLGSVADKEPSAALGLANINIAEQNYTEARTYFDKAVKLGSTAAMIELAKLLYENLDATESLPWPSFLNGRQRAMELFKQASALGVISARHSLADAELEILEREAPADYCAQLESRIVPDMAASARLGDVTAHDHLLKLIAEAKCPMRDEVKHQRIAAALTAGASGGPDLLVNTCIFNRSTSCDPAAAIELLKRASSQGRSNAQFVLASLLQTGRFAVQDLSEASRLLSEIESSGQPDVRLRLAQAWITGSGGLAAQPERGEALLRKMSQEGRAAATLSLGRYLLGVKTESSVAEAIVTLETLARTGDNAPTARGAIASWFYSNWRQVTPASRDLFITWANEDLSDADRARGLGMVYLKYGETARVKSDGFTLLERAAREHKDVQAMVEAGLALEVGNGVEKNRNKAQEYYDQAASLQSNLGITLAAFDCFPSRETGRRCRFSPNDYARMLKKIVKDNYADSNIFVIFGNWLLHPTMFSSEQEVAELVTKLIVKASPERLESLGLVQQSNRRTQPSPSMIRALQKKFRDAKLYSGIDDGRMATLVRGLQIEAAR